MDTLVKADIFFFITSISVILVTLIIAFLSYKIMRAVAEIERLAQTLGENIESAGEDVKDLVLDMRDSFLFRMLFQKRRRNKRNNNG
jgi:hypothetical protein